MEKTEATVADSDSEEGSEVNMGRTLNNITKSVFGATLDLPEDECEKVELTEYEKSLNNEIQQWMYLIKSSQKELKRSEIKSQNIDMSILPEDKRSYLNAAPDLQKFIKESVEFRRLANVYLQKDYKEFLEIHENLIAICNYNLNLTKSTILDKLS